MNFREAKQALESSGYRFLRKADSSHVIFEKDGNKFVLPQHAGKELCSKIAGKVRKVTRIKC